MELFKIKKGTKVVLSNENGVTAIQAITTIDTTFKKEDIVIDPIEYRNSINANSISEGIKGKSKDLEFQIFGPGYYKFRLANDEYINNEKFTYVILIATDVEIL